MTRTCTVCAHSERSAIDQALITGASYRNIAQRWQVGYTAVARHKEHVSDAIEQHSEARALDVVTQLKAINGATLAILTEARQTGDARTALAAIDRLQRQIELQAKLLGELDERPQVNVLVLPEWLAIRAALLQALAPFPAARVAVVDALEATDALA